MVSKVVSRIKTCRGSRGFIGKSVPCTPTFLGYFVLKQYLISNKLDIILKNQFPQKRLVLAKGDRRRV